MTIGKGNKLITPKKLHWETLQIKPQITVSLDRLSPFSPTLHLSDIFGITDKMGLKLKLET